jgi:hypothetical protein
LVAKRVPAGGDQLAPVIRAALGGRQYRMLREPGLDPARLNLYRLAKHLSLVAGPLRLLDGDYPDREPMLSIAEYNTQQVLALQQRSQPALREGEV